MGRTPVTWAVADRILSTEDHTLVMGVLNVTPDSFSDGGRWFDRDAAIAHGRAMVRDGADIVDVGGESTRPGSDPVPVDEEIARVVPVIAALAGEGITLSIDTSKPEVAAAALGAGAHIVNDVTALADADMISVAAAGRAGVVIMHMQGTPRTMQAAPHYADVVGEVSAFLTHRAEQVIAGGVDRDRICLDPGIGFGKNLDHNLALLAAVPELSAAGFPVLVGASRKSWIAHLLGDLPMSEREVPSAVAHALAIAGGAAVIRVHDVVAGLRSARVADAIVGWRGGRST